MEQKIMEWARELQTVSGVRIVGLTPCDRCGVMTQQLACFLKQLELKKGKILPLLPFLEFITWSLLNQDSQGVGSQLWLLSKQRTWKTQTPKYIPNSVWRWIRSASVDITLDPMTNHPWLQLSDDKRKIKILRLT
ncbi:uncharacterized protein si:ch211-114c12.5 isoform X3 [Cyprinus carpio]|uniref:Uncharacterized protein si:ch211-114c12.5 isoform X3 n=1 Tax=Cyprinus carpio TaxID=7962 RepID=A0A9Q9WAC0_CYPCA|nr:uncharacterized protein si:ch211-114c12.5 isoform X3 [Cyprinus carpio]